MEVNTAHIEDLREKFKEMHQIDGKHTNKMEEINSDERLLGRIV